MKKIIITGCNGQLGREMNRLYAGNTDIELVNTDVDELDITSIDAVMKRVRSGGPSAVTKPKNRIVELDGGGLCADFTARTVTIDKKRVDMSPKEYDLFFYMLENRNIALSREKLLCEVWGYDFYGDARTLDTHIKLLRKSLGRYAHYIVTLRGVGYRFEGE